MTKRMATDKELTEAYARSFSSGMVRDSNANKERFDLLIPHNLDYEHLMLTRWAKLLSKGALHYGDRNWEKAQGTEEYESFRDSAFRHFIKWFVGMDDEDHAAAVFFNIQGAEYVKWRN